MTAETLKPFITPTSAENYATTDSSAAASQHRRSCYFLAITASVITVILTAALLGFTIWNTTRISNLQTEVQSLNRVIDNLHKRLGLTYLDDLNDFEKEEENNNALIDDVLPDADADDDDDNDHENMSGDDDEEDEDDDDDDYEDYEELMNKFRHYQETEDDEEETEGADSIGDDNLYDDFEKFNDSKNKHQGERKTRSVGALNDDNDNLEERSHHERQTILRSLKDSYPKSIVTNENFERHRSPLRIHNYRKRKFPALKNGDSLISAKNVAQTNELEVKPAAHFHINHSVPYNVHEVQISNQKGDVYIGKPSASNELNIERYFHVDNGVVTVREPGLYFVYAQICYKNNFSKNGFSIFHKEKPFLQCLHSTVSTNVPLINTCYTSGLINLQRLEQLHIRDFHANRETFLSAKSDRSYFGLIKI